ncbi:MAG: hypothetical protein GYB67_08325 [Chloroflexi bacterium]|nr:hypothetical protein [Chloroflexota bacterium]
MVGTAWHTSADDRNEIGPAMQLLLAEAKYLAQRRHHLSAERYRSAVEALKTASDLVLNMDCRDPEEQRQREWYLQHGDNLWAFLEEHVA